jgi:hypothetical protein
MDEKDRIEELIHDLEYFDWYCGEFEGKSEMTDEEKTLIIKALKTLLKIKTLFEEVE